MEINTAPDGDGTNKLLEDAVIMQYLSDEFERANFTGLIANIPRLTEEIENARENDGGS